MRIDFTTPVTTLSLDAVSNSTADYGRLEIYDANDNLLARYTTQALAPGQHETMTLSRPTADIAYAIARGYADTAVQFDNLRFGPQATAITDMQGVFSLPSLAAGTYRVKMVPTPGNQASGNDTQIVTITAGEARSSVDFGVTALVSVWQNSANRFDVNNDTFVSPIDALQIINDINDRGSRALTNATTVPPYIDVNGDSFVSPIDVLRVINAIDGNPAEGEAALGEITSDASVATTQPLFIQPEGEGTNSGHQAADLAPRAAVQADHVVESPALRAVAAAAHRVATRRSPAAVEWDELLTSLASDVAAVKSQGRLAT